MGGRQAGQAGLLPAGSAPAPASPSCPAPPSTQPAPPLPPPSVHHGQGLGRRLLEQVTRQREVDGRAQRRKHRRHLRRARPRVQHHGHREGQAAQRVVHSAVRAHAVHLQPEHCRRGRARPDLWQGERGAAGASTTLPAAPHARCPSSFAFRPPQLTIGCRLLQLSTVFNRIPFTTIHLLASAPAQRCRAVHRLACHPPRPSAPTPAFAAPAPASAAPQMPPAALRSLRRSGAPCPARTAAGSSRAPGWGGPQARQLTVRMPWGAHTCVLQQ